MRKPVQGTLDVIAVDEHEGVTVYGTNQPDVINTGGGPQTIYAKNGDDIVSAGGGPDLVFGGNGDDYLQGGGGPDQLFGGNGDDILFGGPGPDMLTGGLGNDIFVYAFQGDAPAPGEEEEGPAEGEHSRETITDFKYGVDKIDLSLLGTVTSFSNEATANSVWIEQVGNDAVVMVDINGDVSGDHPAELAILLLNVEASTISQDDFIF